MTNDWLKAQGLISIRDLWMKAKAMECPLGTLEEGRVRPCHERPGARPTKVPLGQTRMPGGVGRAG